jgi:hypothetical protein
MAILGYNDRTQLIRTSGLAEWLETRGLEGWLEIATDGLEAPARQRIANEIGAHYSEAVSGHLAEGESDPDAQAIALAELGDPTQAALNFKKSYLTENEAKALKWMEGTATKPFFSFRMLLLDSIPLTGFVLLFLHLTQNSWLLHAFHVFCGLMLLAYAGFRLIPRLVFIRILKRNSFQTKLVLSYSITTVAFAFIISLLFWSKDHNALLPAWFGFYYGYVQNPGLRIYKKLHKKAHEQNESFPRQTPAF